METHADPSRGVEVFIEALNGLGIDRIFLNPGIDLAPLLSTIGTYRLAEKKAPRVVLCTDESVAVAAAHGCAMVSGKPQMVMVFQDVGLLQGGGAIVNLKYGRVPVILCSGSNPAPNRKNWRGEPFDQGSIVRDYVKWDHVISANEDVSSVLREAFRVASSEPAGPVYLAIDSDVFMGKPGKEAVIAGLGTAGSLPAEIDAADIDEAAKILTTAENPLILTAYSGRHPENVAALVRLAETLGARVITTDLRMNFPSTHPLCPGIESSRGGTYDQYIPEADAILMVDYDFPGPVGKRCAPRADASIIHIDNEPLKNGRVLWNRQPDVLVTGDSGQAIGLLVESIDRCLSDEQRLKIRTRSEKMGKDHESFRGELQALAVGEAKNRPISVDWLCHCINEAIDDETVIVHMIPSNADAFSRQIRRTKPGTMFSWGDSAGSMGWPLGAGLGAKLANPGRTVVSLIGDGGFIFGCPVATLWSAAAYNAPFLTIIFDNQAYGAFKEIIPGFSKDDLTNSALGFEVGISIKDPPDFAAIAQACKAYGQTVEDPSDLPSALRTAIAEVKGGRSAVLDVKIEP
jgi:acetolactate synthase-1/2/3 large subunit